jgi:hypothetical protein
VTATPPSWLRGGYELRVWSSGYAAAVMHGGWDAVFTLSLGVMACCAGRYCRSVIAQRAAARDHPAADGAEIAELRTLVRAMMADWYLLPAQRARLGEVRADGLDADIAKLCGIPD